MEFILQGHKPMFISLEAENTMIFIGLTNLKHYCEHLQSLILTQKHQDQFCLIKQWNGANNALFLIHLAFFGILVSLID